VRKLALAMFEWLDTQTMISCSKRSSLLCGFPSARTVRTSSLLARSKLELVRSRLELVRNKQELELARSKLVQELGSRQVLARSKLELVRSMLVLVHSKRSLPYGNRTNRLR